MNTKTVFLTWMVILGLVLVGCAQPAKVSPTSTPQMEATQPAPTATPSAEDNIRAALAENLNIAAEDVEVHAIEETEWTDSCLGAPQQGEACAEVITPGYGGILIANGVLYEFHSDQRGKTVRFIPGAAIAARQILLTQLGLELKDVKISHVEAVTWKDSCLEIVAEGQTCSATPVAGYRVIVQAKAESYEYHTDETGGDVRLAAAPAAPEIEAIITWSDTVEGRCQQARLDGERVVFGLCGGPQMAVSFVAPGRADEIHELAERYAPFKAETQAGSVELTGNGVITATPADQRIVAEWAKAAMLEAMGGSSEASWGLAFAWHREGGIAGVCEDVTVFLSGISTASSCSGGTIKSLGKTWLTGNQMWQLYSWIDTYQYFDYETSDLATADGLTVRLIFNGDGSQEADEFEQKKLIALAEEVVGQLATEQSSTEMQTAKETLEAYLAALAKGDYTKAASLYGGSYEVLQNNNPTTPGDDYQKLFQLGCTLNGFVCNLAIKSYVHEVQFSPTDFRFTVELQNPDGSLFLLGPCCGENPAVEPPWSQFDFLVNKVEGVFKVMDLPVYVP